LDMYSIRSGLIQIRIVFTAIPCLKESYRPNKCYGVSVSIGLY
jgi:hypothetical protein